MNKNLLFIFLFVIACGKDDDPARKSVISVAPQEQITVAFGTSFSAISFPEKVTVTYNDNTTEDVPVSFSQGTYNNTVAGLYELEGTLTLPAGTLNPQNLKATISVKVASLKLRTVTEDGVIRFEYFYDEAERLDRYRVYSSPSTYTGYTYYYLSDNKIEKRIRNHAGLLFPEKYFYNSNGTLNRIEFYTNTDELSQTHTYTYSGNKVERIDNSDQSIDGLKYRTYEYDAQGNVKKVIFDFGSPWTYAYYANQKKSAPLKLDPANPLNQAEQPIESFSYVQFSSYTAVYEYNAAGYPTKETRTFPGDNNKQIELLYTYE